MDRDGLDRLRQLHAAADARWPAVRWPFEQYRAHVTACLGHHAGRASPRHPLDLYLAGAAGCRLDAAWVAIETELCPQAVRLLRRWVDAGPDRREELVARARTRWLHEDRQRQPLCDGRQPAVIGRYRGLVSLLNYLLTTARRLAISDHRRHQPLVSLPLGDDAVGPGIALPAAATDPPDVAAAPRELAALIQRALSDAFAGLSVEQQFLLRMVVSERMKQKQAGRLLGLSEFQTSRELTRARDHLRAALGELVDVAELAWSPTFRDAWAVCWARLLEQAPARPPARPPRTAGRRAGRPAGRRRRAAAQGPPISASK